MALAIDPGDGVKTTLSVSWAEERICVPILGCNLNHALQVPHLSFSGDGGTTPITWSEWRLTRWFTTPFLGETTGTSQTKMDVGVSTAIIQEAFLTFLHRPAVSIKRNLDVKAYSGFNSPPNDQVFYFLAAESSAASLIDNAKLVYSGGAAFGASARLAALDINAVLAGQTVTAGASDATLAVGWDNANAYSLVQIVLDGFNHASQHIQMECSANGGAAFLTLMDNATFAIGIGQLTEKFNDVSSLRMTAGTSARVATQTASVVISIPFPHLTGAYKRVFAELLGHNPTDSRVQSNGQTGATNPAATDTINHVRFSMSGGANIEPGAKVQVLIWP